MLNINEGKQGHYFWLERSLDAENVSRPMSALIEKCDEVLLNNYLVVSSLDSGPPRLTQQQTSEGWQRHGELALSPKLSQAGVVPFEWFDEWYIFDSPTSPIDLEVFVNYGTFSLSEPNWTIETMYIGSDDNVRAQMATAVVQLRQKF